ncbi:MAG: hypothetical protein ACXU82_08445 [Caulobacteraceae bacterium]
MLRRIAAVGLLLALAGGAQAQTRVEIPIREVVQSNGQHRYTIPITVGGVQIEAGIDSGSTGLRILPGVVPAAAEQGSGRRTSYSYDNGVEFDGVVVEADMTIGVSGRVKFQQIDKVGCKPGLRTCQAVTVKPEAFGIQSGGLPNEGFKAILGINMATDVAPNPFMAMGVKRWIIDLPRPGEGKPGRLVLNPADAEVADYKLFHIDDQFGDQRGGLHDAIQACIVNNSNKRSYCGPTDLDTGAPGVQVAASDASDMWRPQTPVTIAFYDRGRAVIGAEFTVGQGPGTRLSFRAPPRRPETHIYLGIMPYFAFSTLYDPAARTIGLKAR